MKGIIKESVSMILELIYVCVSTCVCITTLVHTHVHISTSSKPLSKLITVLVNFLAAETNCQHPNFKEESFIQLLACRSFSLQLIGSRTRWCGRRTQQSKNTSWGAEDSKSRQEIGDSSSSFLSLLQSNYATQLREDAKQSVDKFSNLVIPAPQFQIQPALKKPTYDFMGTGCTSKHEA